MAEQRTVRVKAVDAAEILPCFAMIELGGTPGRLFGWIEETIVGGANFLEVQMPKGTRRKLVNAHQVRMLTVLDEEIATKFAPHAWRNGQ